MTRQAKDEVREERITMEIFVLMSDEQVTSFTRIQPILHFFP